MTMRLTDQQVAICDAATAGTSFVVEAGAGTGKTSTMVAVADVLGPHLGPLLYMSYNKAIVLDAQGAMPPHVTCSTAHSIAYRAIGHLYRGAMDCNQIAGWQLAKAFYVRRWHEGAHQVSGPRVAILARGAIDRWSKTMDPVITGRHVPQTPSIDGEERKSLVAHVLPIARRMWDTAQNPDQRLIKFKHDWYLRMFASMGPGGSVPQLGTRVLFFDECQDADPIMRFIFEHQGGCQRIAVGDSQQSIYAWRGAENAIQAFREAGAPMFPLTTSWRFGTDIATEANAWLDALDAEIRLTGNPAIDSTIGEFDTAGRHAVVCRTNAGVMGTVVEGLDAGRKVAMVGCDKSVKALAGALNKLHQGKETDHEMLAGFATWSELVDFATGDECDDPTLRMLVTMSTRPGHSPASLSRAMSLCVPEREADLVVTTGHKSKGRQWENVKVHSDYQLKTDPTTGDTVKYEVPDLRLAYVTVTRARHCLNPGPLAGVL